ncbi:MAG TPA: hypothetical protein VHH36_08395 [Candidatus Thermoplasmatota archaeon]|nr:hypothetical protein [Candidatus Thermoplasmatota archaeon]
MGGGTRIYAGAVTGSLPTDNCHGVWTPTAPPPGFEEWSATVANLNSVGVAYFAVE